MLSELKPETVVSKSSDPDLDPVKADQFRHNFFLVQGRCGVCGDEYSAAVKPHEAGGM
jgi:hypothetical protein